MQHCGQSAIQLLDGGMDLNEQAAREAPLTFATCFQGCGGHQKCEVWYILDIASLTCCLNKNAEITIIEDKKRLQCKKCFPGT